jgi:hypothetical protein
LATQLTPSDATLSVLIVVSGEAPEWDGSWWNIGQSVAPAMGVTASAGLVVAPALLAKVLLPASAEAASAATTRPTRMRRADTAGVTTTPLGCDGRGPAVPA